MSDKIIIHPSNKEELIRWTFRLFSEFDNGLKEIKEKLDRLEKMWQCDHWHNVKKKDDDDIQPVTPTIWSLTENVLADLMDNMPENNLVGRVSHVKDVADLMESNIKAFYERDQMEMKYMTCCRRAIKFPAGIMRVTFDPDKLDGEGDVSLSPVDMRNCFWDPEYEDIQDGRAFIYRDMVPLEAALRDYPQLKEDDLAGGDLSDVDVKSQDGRGKKASEKIPIYGIWYRKPIKEEVEIADVVVNGEAEEVIVRDRRIRTYHQLHMATLIGRKVVYWSEEDEHNKDGVYDHGMIPFVYGRFFPIDGTPTGLSMVEIFEKLAQYADKMDQFILKNAYRASHERHFYNKEMVDPSDVKDRRNELVGCEGDPRAAIFTQQAQPLNADAYNKKRDIVDTIKDESGQNQFNRGEGGRGVTSAAGIRALKQFGAKRSRTMGRCMYSFFDKITEQVLALMLQYYTPDRWQMFIEVKDDWDITNLDQTLKDVKLWQFGVESKVQRNTAEDSWYYMELAFEFMDRGFPPEACLKLMEFDGKTTFETALEAYKNEEARIEAAVQEQVEAIMAQQASGGAEIPQGPMDPVTTEDGGKLI